MDKLKLCPFCGSVNLAQDAALSDYIECRDCGAYGPDGGVEGWNTRAESPELTAANARVAELKRVNAIMDEELRTKTQALFNLESENKVLKDIDAHRQPHFESLQQEYYAERDRRMKLEEALGQLHDSASEYAADQSGANDPRCGVVQPISVADGEALNDALRRAAALLEKK